MKTICTEVYTIDELDNKAKERARAWYKEGDEYPLLEDYMAEEVRNMLDAAGIEHDDNIKVYYSLSWCQGDGAMFEGTGMWTYKGITYSWNTTHSGHYYHYNSKNIQLIDDAGYCASEDVEIAFNDVYVDICRKLEKAGYAYIGTEQEDTNVDENMRANEYTFTKDGKRFG